MARNKILKPLVFVACLLPLAWLVYAAFTANLGANPVEKIQHQTGLTTLILLLTGLAITPLRRLSGINWLIQYRRMIGLFAFFYGSLHFLSYLLLDQEFKFGSILHDVAKRPFITMGTLSWLTMLPLALTSTQASIRRLGKNWQRLHRLVYLSAAAGAIHFFWLVKQDKREPGIYLLVLAVLLGWRVVLWSMNRRRKAQVAQGVGV